MDRYALWIGYAVMVSGGFALTACLLGLVLDYMWRKTKATMDWDHLQEALSDWHAKKRAEKLRGNATKETT